MPDQLILLIATDPFTLQTLEHSILQPAGYQVRNQSTLESAVKSIEISAPDAIILTHPLQEADALTVGSELITRFPQIPVIFFSNEPTNELTSQAVHRGFCDILSTPVHPQEISHAVEAAVSRSQKLKEWIHLETNQDVKSIQNRIESRNAAIFQPPDHLFA